VWAAQHGLTVAAAVPGTLTHAPLALLPARFPRAAFEQAQALAAPFGALTAAVAADGAFLRETLARAGAEDAFTGRLLELHAATEGLPGRGGGVTLGLLRSDYMVDAPSGALLQVEVNTIAASFAHLSQLTTALHAHLTRWAGLQSRFPAAALPANGAATGLAAGLAQAWRLAGRPHALVLVVVQPGERNVFDQQGLQCALRDTHGIRTLRRSLAQLAVEGRLEGGRLLVGEAEVAVVYYRAGYTPDDYPSEACWAGRELLERSSAIACPSLAWHLAGAKKVQQQLARPGCVERFLAPAQAAAVRAAFAGLWPLDGPEADAVVAMALQHPERYVLKPQREGGGNNLYGEEAAARLRRGDGLGAFILMQRILPAVQPALFLRQGVVSSGPALCELGIYSVYLAAGNEVLQNAPTGHLLRTKTADSDEGGVAAGFAVLDSPCLEPF